ncbi:MAG: hypothetical protein HHJ12_12185 [Glaciimonas sp.]|nr:hypothetical protein [Glaciimonas sp.]
MSNIYSERNGLPEERIVREMGCSRSEFMRWLPGATRQAVLHSSRHGEQDLHRIVTPGGTVVITTVIMAPRRIALMTLPVLQVIFHFIDMEAPAQADFMHYFDLYTRRGGG